MILSTRPDVFGIIIFGVIVAVLLLAKRMFYPKETRAYVLRRQPRRGDGPTRRALGPSDIEVLVDGDRRFVKPYADLTVGLALKNFYEEDEERYEFGVRYPRVNGLEADYSFVLKAGDRLYVESVRGIG